MKSFSSQHKTLVLLLVLLLVCGFVSLIHKKVAAPDIPNVLTGESIPITKENVEKTLLGRWAGTTVEEPSDVYENIGLVHDESGQKLRRYDKKGNIQFLEKWEVREKNGSVYVVSYDLNAGAEEDFLNFNLKVQTLTHEKVTLLTINEMPETLVWTRVKSADEELKTVLTLTGSELREACKSLLTEDNFAEQSLVLPVSCEYEIGKGVNVVVNFAADGTVNITQNGKILFEGDNDNEDALVDTYMLIREGILGNSPITFKDLNFDGYKDMYVRTSAGAYNFTYDLYTYNPKSQSFNVLLSSVVNPTFDAKEKTITSFFKGRGLGDLYNQSTYHFNGTSYIEVKSEEQYYTDDDHPEKGYDLTTYELKNGTMVKTSTVHLTEEEVMGQ